MCKQISDARSLSQDVVDNHEEAANAAPLALRLCNMVRFLQTNFFSPCPAYSSVGPTKRLFACLFKLMHFTNAI